MQLAEVYRQTNPQASKEQFFRDVGMQAWMALGLNTAQLAAKLAPAAQEPEPPTPAAPQQPAGYTPAAPGTSTPPAPPAPSNPFEQLSHEFGDEEY